MARSIDGAASSGVDYGAGALVNATATANAFTMAAIVRKTSANGVYCRFLGLYTSGNVDVGSLTVNNAGTSADSLEWTVNNNVTWTTSIKLTSADGWCLVAASRAAGSGALAPRMHKYVFSTNTWTHANASGTLAGNTGAAASFWTGYGVSAMSWGPQAAWLRVLADAEIESLPFSLSAWWATSPSGLWVPDQSDTSMLINDQTGQGGDQVYIQGTVVSADSVPVLSYGHPVIIKTRMTPTSAGPLQYRAGSGVSAVATSTSTSVTIPTAVKAGDTMFLVATYKVLTGTAVLTTPAGWQVVDAPVNGPSGNTFQGAVFSKVATGTPGSQATEAGTTVSTGGSSSQQLNLAFAAYQGAHNVPRAVSFVVGSTTASASITATAPGTAPVAGDLVVLVGAVRGSTNGPASEPTFSGPGGATIRAQSANVSGSAQNTAVFIGDHDSSSGDRTVTASQTSWAIAGQIILRPVVANTSVSSDVAESLTVGDAVARAADLVRASSEGLALGNTVSAGVVLARDTSEGLTAGGVAAATRAQSRGTSESLTSADAVATVVTRPAVAAESLTLGHTLAVGGAYARGVGEAVSLGHTLAAISGQARGLAEAIGLAGAGAVVSAKPRAQAEAVTLGNALAAVSAYTRAAGESVSLAHTLAVISGQARGVAGALTLSDALARGSLAYTRAVSEGVSLAHVLAVTSVKARAQGESLTLGNALAAVTAQPRSQAETLVLGNAIAATRVQSRGTSETLTSSDAWFYTVGRFIGVAEALHLVDAVAGAMSAPRGIAQSITLTDGFNPGTGVTIAVLEDMSMADAWVRQVSAPRMVGEGMSVDSDAAPVVALSVGVAESLTCADDWFAGLVVLIGFAETVGFGDASVVAAAGYGRAVAETLTLGHSFGRQVARDRAVAQTITVSDGWVRVAASARAVPESVTLADVWVRARSVVRAVAEALGMGNTFARQTDRPRGVAQTVSLVDAVTGGRFVNTSTGEAIAVADQFARAATGYARADPESVNLGHSFVRQTARARTVAEAIAMIDDVLVSRQIIPVVAAIEMTFSTQMDARTSRVRAIAGSLAPVDSLSRLIDRSRSTSELVHMSDLPSAIRAQQIFGSSQIAFDDLSWASTATVRQIAVTLALEDSSVAASTGVEPIIVAHAHRVFFTDPGISGLASFDSGSGTIRRTV